MTQPLIQRARSYGDRWSTRGSPLRQRVYTRLLSNAYSREQFAAGRGISAHGRGDRQEKEIYTLRRNVHMLEKGLSMVPLRETFATAYISETVTLLHNLRDEALLRGVERSWVDDVLHAYFIATEKSTHPSIIHAREAFRKGGTPDLGRHIDNSPHAPSRVGSSVRILSVEQLQSLAKRRRSVRWYLDRPVQRDLVDRAVELAVEAPSACNRQPYRFHIFDQAQDIAKVAAIPMGTAGYDHQLRGLIVVVGDLSAFFDIRDRHLIYVDSSLAVMSLLLGLEAQGVSSLCINWPDIEEKEKEMRTLLDLEEYERIVMLVAYGYADPEGLVPFSGKRQLDAVRRFRSL